MHPKLSQRPRSAFRPPQRILPASLALTLSLPLLLAGASGCVETASEEEDLRALLDDGDVTALTVGALSTGDMASAAAARPPRGSGGSPGDDCMPTGSGGFIFDGGVGGQGSGGTTGLDGGMPASGGSTGSAGTMGSAGRGGAIAVGSGGAAGSSRVPLDMGGGRGGTGGGFTPPPPMCVPPGPHPLGQWSFDDCNDFRTDLNDSSPSFHTAFRSVSTACTTGISNQGLAFDGKADLVYVPDQPDFTFERGVTVAAWANPSSLSGAQSIFRKREEGTSSFLLLANGKKFQFIVSLTDGKAVTVSAPAQKNVWTHVAGTYDGKDARLYLNGVQAAFTHVRGTLSSGAGPVLIGNDADHRRFDGMLDNAFFDNQAISADAVLALTCLHQQPTASVVPAMSAPVAPGTPVTFDVSVTNNDSPACPASFYQFNSFGPNGFFVNPQFSFVGPVSPGQSEHIAVEVTSPDDAESGSTSIPFFFFTNDGMSFSEVSGEMIYVTLATGCRVATPRELMIKSTSVVDDPVRTNPPSGGPADPRAGAWTFARLMRDLAPTPEQAPDMVEDVLQSFTTPQTVNGFTIDPRDQMQPLVLGPFPRLADGSLDLDHAPVRLLAIVNRVDLRNLAQGNAGEGRFVFGVLGPGGFPLQFTMIFEYKLPATTLEDVQAWADRWHALGELPFPSEEYNAALQAVTELFVSRGARPGATNGSALAQFRTNEIDMTSSRRWQFREFTLSPATGLLTPATVKLTPDLGFNGTQTLADFVNANEMAIISETHEVPLSFQGAPFLGGSVFNDLIAWVSPGINNNEARHHFSLNTCNGCHSTAETGVFFLQVEPRFPGQEAFLSGFLTGTTVFDPVTGQPRQFNDLGRRNRDLKALVCPPDMGGGTGGAGGGMGTGGSMGGGMGGRSGGGTGGASGTGGAGGGGMMIPPPRAALLSKGISRVH